MATDNGENTVGFKRPPRQHRFKPGQSGNPKGRPKGTRNLRTDLDEILSGTIQVSVNGEPQQLSRQQVMLLNLFERAAGKDLAATRMLLDLVLKLLIDKSSAQASETDEHLSDTDQAIVDDFLRRNGCTRMVDATPLDTSGNEASKPDNNNES